MPAQKKKPLTKTYLAALGIPFIFFPGLILASLLGWDWQQGLASIKADGYKQSEVIFPKSATVTHVLDGDTLEIDNGQMIRLVGIDAPNRGEEKYDEAAEFLRGAIEKEPVAIEYDYYQEDKYGRLLGYVYESCQTDLGCKDGKRMLNWVMVKKGYAKTVKYKERRKIKYEDYLNTAQETESP